MRRKDVIGFFNLIIVAGILGAISYAALVLQPPEYDSQTLCLSGDQPPHYAIVIDKTDLYSPQQARAIRDLVLDSRTRLDMSERMSLFELDARGELIHTHNFSLCNPGRGEQINPLYRNPQRVQARYEALFEAPLQNALADLVEPKDSPQSPIIEALADLALEPDFDRTTPRRTIILVSDMLQNSQLFSVYGRARGPLTDRLPHPDLVVRELENTYGDVLNGVRIEIHLIPREGWESEQETVLQSYWSSIFSRLGMQAQWREL
ncbi:hypothetical protein [Woodsholea maritima]|uniref:hypothetical protein n=1 Tax=Woodsholea maritima TaxID=240237 RepID=UPI00035EDCCC|nr:hypothetical protein [Woodsholea maritima]